MHFTQSLIIITIIWRLIYLYIWNCESDTFDIGLIFTTMYVVINLFCFPWVLMNWRTLNKNKKQDIKEFVCRGCISIFMQVIGHFPEISYFTFVDVSDNNKRTDSSYIMTVIVISTGYALAGMFNFFNRVPWREKEKEKRSDYSEEEKKEEVHETQEVEQALAASGN